MICESRNSTLLKFILSYHILYHINNTTLTCNWDIAKPACVCFLKFIKQQNLSCRRRTLCSSPYLQSKTCKYNRQCHNLTHQKAMFRHTNVLFSFDTRDVVQIQRNTSVEDLTKCRGQSFVLTAWQQSHRMLAVCTSFE